MFSLDLSPVSTRSLKLLKEKLKMLGFHYSPLHGFLLAFYLVPSALHIGTSSGSLLPSSDIPLKFFSMISETVNVSGISIVTFFPSNFV